MINHKSFERTTSTESLVETKTFGYTQSENNRPESNQSENEYAKYQRRVDHEILAREAAVLCLNRLVETCKDSQQGFKTAAQSINNPMYGVMFLNYALQRTNFIEELEYQIRLLDGNPERTGSLIGAIHRGWIDLKASILSGKETSILDECVRGEESAVSIYREVLKEPLLLKVRMVVQNQFQEIQSAFERICTLEAIAAR
jgi:uncharacterized protein (TIGR02284 family)